MPRSMSQRHHRSGLKPRNYMVLVEATNRQEGYRETTGFSVMAKTKEEATRKAHNHVESRVFKREYEDPDVFDVNLWETYPSNFQDLARRKR
jgi:hypothetical protein